MLKIEIARQIEFRKDRFVVKKLFDSPEAKYVLFCFRGGQTLAEHKTSSSIAVQFFSGKARFSIGNQIHMAEAGSIFWLEPDLMHGIEALEDTVVLLTLTPSPSMHTLLKNI